MKRVTNFWLAAAQPTRAACTIGAMHTEDVVGLVLGALHPKLRERCSEAKILSDRERDQPDGTAREGPAGSNFARLRRALQGASL